MKKMLALLLAAVLAASLAGCGDPTADPTAEPAEEAAAEETAAEETSTEENGEEETAEGESKGTIGIGLFYLRDEYYIDLATRLVAACEEAGYDTQVIDTDADSARMVAAIGDFTAKGND